MDSQRPVTMLDYWRVAWRARAGILAFTVLTAVVAFGVGRLLPKVYTARATILSPKEAIPQSFSLSVGALLGGGGGGGGGRDGGGQGAGLSLPGLSMGLPSFASNQDSFIALMTSRVIREEVTAEFAKTWGPSVNSMLLSVEPDTRQKGILGVVVEARDPKLAADLANEYLQHLDRMLERYADRATQRTEIFYTNQLERAAKEVEAAESALLKFQVENRYLAVDASSKGTAESVASLRGAIMSLEMQREVMRMRLTDQHPQLQELEKQIAELKKAYSKNLFGGAMDLPPESPTAKGRRREFFVPAEKMTPVQFSFLRLFRNLKIQEAFYLAALQGLQQISYQHGLTRPRIELLDPAVPPSVPSRPNLVLIVSVAAVSALLAGVFAAFIGEHFRRVSDRERPSQPFIAGRRKRDESRAPRPAEREGLPAGRVSD